MNEMGIVQETLSLEFWWYVNALFDREWADQ